MLLAESCHSSHLASSQVLSSGHPSAKGPSAALNPSGQHPKVELPQGCSGSGLHRRLNPDRSSAVSPVVVGKLPCNILLVCSKLYAIGWFLMLRRVAELRVFLLHTKQRGQLRSIFHVEVRSYIQTYPDGIFKLTSVINLKSFFTRTCMGYSNDMFLYMFKAEFDLLVCLKVPSGCTK